MIRDVLGKRFGGFLISIIIIINKVDSVSFFLYVSFEDVLFFKVLEEVFILDIEFISKIKFYVCI